MSRGSGVRWLETCIKQCITRLENGPTMAQKVLQRSENEATHASEG